MYVFASESTNVSQVISNMVNATNLKKKRKVNVCLGSSESKASLITGISLYMQFYILLGETVFYVFTAEVAKWVLEEDVKNSEELKNDRISVPLIELVGMMPSVVPP